MSAALKNSCASVEDMRLLPTSAIFHFSFATLYLFSASSALFSEILALFSSSDNHFSASLARQSLLFAQFSVCFTFLQSPHRPYYSFFRSSSVDGLPYLASCLLISVRFSSRSFACCSEVSRALLSFSTVFSPPLNLCLRSSHSFSKALTCLHFVASTRLTQNERVQQ